MQYAEFVNRLVHSYHHDCSAMVRCPIVRGLLGGYSMGRRLG